MVFAASKLEILTTRMTRAASLQAVSSYTRTGRYFEHLGRVRDNQDVAIAFTSGQLNDVLKSITVLDINGGRSQISVMARPSPSSSLGDLRLPAGEKTSITDFLAHCEERVWKSGAGNQLHYREGSSVSNARLGLPVARRGGRLPVPDH